MSVKHAILALLYQQQMYGYEISKQLPLTLRGDRDVKPGQIASTLTRLERDQLVEHHIESGEDAPDRKVYTLTEEGIKELKQWYLMPEVRDYRLGDAFYLKLVFSLLDAPVKTEDIMRNQRRRLYQELHEVTQIRSELNDQNDLPFILLLETAMVHLDADIRWLEMCEARLPELRRYSPPTPLPQVRGRPRVEPKTDDESI